MSIATIREIAAPGGLVGGPFGSNLVSADYVERGVPVIRGENLGLGKWVDGDFAFVTAAKAASDLARNVALAGDLVFTQRGTLGQAAIVPPGSYPEYVISQSQMRLRPDASIADVGFVYYACTSASFIQQINDRAIATGVPHINLGLLAELVIPLPSLPEQRAIAEVLGALDDKIATNSRIAQALDQFADSKVDAASRESELVSIEALAAVSMGSSPRGESLNEEGVGLAFHQGTRDFGRRVPTTRVFTTAPVRIAQAGDILLSVRAPVGTVNRADRELCIGRGIAALRSTTATPHVLFHVLRRAQDSWAPFNNEGTVFGSINQADLRRVRVPWARQAELRGLEAELMPLEARVDSAMVESRRLADLRDTLLPHLMSGRLTVRQAERAASDAL